MTKKVTDSSEHVVRCRQALESFKLDTVLQVG